MAKRWHYRVNHAPIQLIPNCDVLVEKIAVASQRQGLSLEEKITLNNIAKDVLRHDRVLPKDTLKAYNKKVHSILYACQKQN